MLRLLYYLLTFSVLLLPAALAAGQFTGNEMTDGYMTVVDERGAVILRTGLAIHPGDQYINDTNRLYEITSVEGTLAKARFMGEVAVNLNAPVVPAQAPPPTEDPLRPPPETTDQLPPATIAPAPPQKQRIALYYTHSDESFIPGDGSASIPGNGGIFQVGGVMAQRLTELGYDVENDQTKHDPHDANAYQRSRRTFTRLLEGAPVTLFDVHRDSAPLSEYQITINGQEAAKMLLVVGNENQNRQTSMDYAQTIKNAADAKYSGLIRGIFIAHGNYNQDLSPRAMLVEIGTQYNSKEAAERSAALFADIVPSALAAAGTVPEVPAPAPPTPMTQAWSYGRDIVTVIGVTLACVLAYLYLSTGSWQEAKRKLTRFRKYEFTNFLGPRRKRKD